MKYVVLDTSSQESYISLFDENNLLNCLKLPLKEQTKSLHPLLLELLSSYNLTLNDLSFIAPCIGPGTYTGTRIGVTAAKLLSYGCKIPIIPFHSLVPWLPTNSKRHLAVLPAKSQEYFASFGKAPIYLSQEELLHLITPDITVSLPKNLYENIPNQICKETPTLNERLRRTAGFVSHKYKSLETTDPADIKVLYLKMP